MSRRHQHWTRPSLQRFLDDVEARPRRHGHGVPADQRRVQPAQRAGRRCGGPTARASRSCCAPTRRRTPASSRATGTTSGAYCSRCTGSCRSTRRTPAGTTRPASTSARSAWSCDFFAGHAAVGHRAAPDELPARGAIFVDTIAQVHRPPLDVLPRRARAARPTGTSYIDGVLEHLRTLDARVADANPALHYAAAQLARAPSAAGAADVRARRLPAGEHPGAGRGPGADVRLGVRPHRRPARGPRLLQPPARAAEPVRGRPGGFLARYRERTGLDRGAGQRDTVSYFYVLGMARLLGQMLEAADALARAGSRGVMATYMLNGISATTRAFVEIARRIAKLKEQPCCPVPRPSRSCSTAAAS